MGGESKAEEKIIRKYIPDVLWLVLASLVAVNSEQKISRSQTHVSNVSGNSTFFGIMRPNFIAQKEEALSMLEYHFIIILIFFFFNFKRKVGEVKAAQS